MRRFFLSLSLGLVLVGAGCSPTIQPAVISTPYQITPMQLTSSAFKNNEPIPPVYTCDGKSITPPLEITGAPTSTKSFAITLEDPDTAKGTFDHWVQFNLPAGMAVIPEGKAPGTSGTNGAGTSGYIGPCPPTGSHHYIFKLYALDALLDLSSSAKKADLLNVLDGHVLAEAELVGMYQKQK